MNEEINYRPGSIVPFNYEYPKIGGWHWFRYKPNLPWEAVLVLRDDKLFFKRIGVANCFVDETWEAQWGGKIEEPKA